MKISNIFISSLFLGLFSLPSYSQDGFLDWQTLEKKVIKEGINKKAFGHMKCFIEQESSREFSKANLNSSPSQCGKNKTVALGNQRVLTLIDYTVKSNKERMFLIDRKTGAISHMAVAHGRYEAGYVNQISRKNKNTVLKAKYFSNKLGSNASSTGFFITGGEYYGKFGRSLVLHGLEAGVNDNACKRAVVIHEHKLMTKKRAFVMSSGCPMVDSDLIDHVIDVIKAPNANSNGSLVFAYGPREEQWAEGSCNGNFNYY